MTTFNIIKHTKETYFQRSVH